MCKQKQRPFLSNKQKHTKNLRKLLRACARTHIHTHIYSNEVKCEIRYSNEFVLPTHPGREIRYSNEVILPTHSGRSSELLLPIKIVRVGLIWNRHVDDIYPKICPIAIIFY